MKITQILLSSLLAISSISSVSAAEPYKISTISGSSFVDIVSPLLVDAYGQLDLTIEIIPMQAADALFASNSGKTDAESHRIDGVETKYKNLVKVPTVIGYVQPYVFYKEDFDVAISSWTDLVSHKVAIRKGVRFAENGTEGLPVIKAENLEQLFGWLEQGTIDVVVTSEINGLTAIKNLGLKNLQGAPIIGERYLLHHYLHVKNSHLVEPLDAAFKNLESSGKIESAREAVVKQLSN